MVQNTTQNTQTSRIALLAIMIAVGMIAGAPLVAADDVNDQPDELPAAYYGELELNGEDAPTGVTVIAEIDGVEKGEITTDEAGAYGSEDADGEKLQVDAGEDGDEVTFYVTGDDFDRTEVDDTTPSPVTWESSAVEQVNIEATVEFTDDEDEDDNGDDDSSGGSNGSGSSGGADDSDDATGEDDADDAVSDDEEADSQPDAPTASEVREELEQTEPNTDSRTEIVDADPDRSGVSVSPEETESVRQVTFSDDSASGNVDIQEWQTPSESVSDSVSGAAAEASDETGENTVTTTNVVTVADITPDSDEVRDAPGTVEIAVDTDRVNNPENVVVAHERGDDWEILPTTVSEEDGEVIAEAETDSFSLFSVANVETEVIEEEQDDVPEEPVESDDEIPGFGVLIALAAIIGAALLARYKNSS